MPQQDYYDAYAAGDYGSMYDMFMQDYDLPGAMGWSGVQLQGYLQGMNNPQGGSPFFDVLPPNTAYLQDLRHMNRKQRIARDVASAYAFATMPEIQNRSFNQLRHGVDPEWEKQFANVQKSATEEARKNTMAQMQMSEGYIQDYLAGLGYLANPYSVSPDDPDYDPEQAIPSFFQPFQEGMYDQDYVWGGGEGEYDYTSDQIQDAFYQQMNDTIAAMSWDNASGLNMNQSVFDYLMGGMVEGTHPWGQQQIVTDSNGNIISQEDIFAQYTQDTGFEFDMSNLMEYQQWVGEQGFSGFNLDFNPTWWADMEGNYGYGAAPEGTNLVGTGGNQYLTDILEEYGLNWEDIQGNADWWGDVSNQDAINAITTQAALAAYQNDTATLDGWGHDPQLDDQAMSMLDLLGYGSWEEYLNA